MSGANSTAQQIEAIDDAVDARLRTEKIQTCGNEFRKADAEVRTAADSLAMVAHQTAVARKGLERATLPLTI